MYECWDAKSVAKDLAGLQAWLNDKAKHGWILVSADGGVLYLYK